MIRGVLSACTRWVIAAAIGIAVTTSSACSSPTPTLPDVAGMQLDDAHNVLKDASYKVFEDVDLVEDRQEGLSEIFDGDDDWAVIRQTPAGGSELEHDDTVRLEVLKKRDADILSRLPATSPVREEVERIAEERAEDQAEEDARREEEESKPLDCREPTLEIDTESWEVVEASAGAPANFGRSIVRATITNPSEHKVASAGIVFTTGYRDPSGRVRSTSELGGYGLAVALVPDQSLGHPEWVTVNPGDEWEIERDFRFIDSEKYHTDGSKPWMDEVFVKWHFQNEDLDRACKEAGAGTR